MKVHRIVLIGLLVILAAACANNPSTSQTSVQALQPSATTPPTAAPTQAAPTAAPTQAANAENAQPSAAEPVTGDLILTGLVEKPSGWLSADIKTMPKTTGNGKNGKGEPTPYSGVLVADLLKLASPKTEAKTLVFLGEGDVHIELPLADVMACKDCIVTSRSQGGFSLLLPFYADQLAMKGLVEIQVK